MQLYTKLPSLYYSLLLCLFVFDSLLVLRHLFHSFSQSSPLNSLSLTVCLSVSLSQGLLSHALLPILYNVFVAVMKSCGSVLFYVLSVSVICVDAGTNTHWAAFCPAHTHTSTKAFHQFLTQCSLYVLELSSLLKHSVIYDRKVSANLWLTDYMRGGWRQVQVLMLLVSVCVHASCVCVCELMRRDPLYDML